MSPGPFPSLIVITPLISSFFVFAIGWFRPGFIFPAVVTVLSACCLFAGALLAAVLTRGATVRYFLGGWEPPWGIEYAVDHLNGLVLVCVAVAALLIALHSRSLVQKEIPREKHSQFYALFVLQVTGLFGMTITGDAFNLYVLLEIASFSAYALIGMGEKGAEFAAFRYMIFGTIGACAYLLGVGYLYVLTGSLNMADLRNLLPAFYHTVPFAVGVSFLLVGVAIKMALFPLHSWLPDAYTFAPSAVTGLLAPLFTKVGAYVLVRLLFTIFDPTLAYSILPVGTILGWIGAAGILFAGVMALAQTDLKRMLCYLIVAETGFVAVGVASGNQTGLIGAVFHVVNDIFMMACLFAAVGSIYAATGSRNMDTLGGLHRRLPLTLGLFLVGAFSIVGIPPLCGFFSKWYLVLGAIEARQWFFLAALLAGSLINVIIFFRVFERAYMGAAEKSPSGSIAIRPPVMMEVIPMACMALIILLLGIFSGTVIGHVIRFAVPGKV